MGLQTKTAVGIGLLQKKMYGPVKKQKVTGQT